MAQNSGSAGSGEYFMYKLRKRREVKKKNISARFADLRVQEKMDIGEMRYKINKKIKISNCA